MRRTLLTLLALALLAGCQSATPTRATTGPAQTETESLVKLSQSFGVTGSIRGFTGEHKKYTAADAAKTTIAVRDGEGAVIKSSTVSADKGGSFTVPGLASGAYFVVVTLADGTVLESLLRTDGISDNYVSPGTTLACAWAHDQLAKKLVFMAELPYGQLQGVGAKLDSALEDKGTALAGSVGQLSQLQQLTSTYQEKGIQDALNVIAAALDKRAIANMVTMPLYANKGAYEAKKAAVAAP